MIKNKFRPAFTIVELIVVIAVIGILAGIVLVSYGAWRNNTIATQVKNDLNATASAMENHRTFNNSYPTTLPTTVTPSHNVTLTLSADSTATKYCVDGVSSDNPTATYYIASETKDKGALPGTCATRPNQTIPAVPTGLAITNVTPSEIDLQWNSVAGALTYTVQCASDQAYINNIKSVTQSSTSIHMTGLISNTTYYCRVKATNGGGSSGWTVSVSGSTDNTNVWTSVAVLFSHFSTKTDGSLWSWGYNGDGRLGTGDTSGASSATPIKIINGGVVDVEGSGAIFARKSDGSLWGWGYNSSYNLGIGDNITRYSPVQVISSGVTNVIAGGGFTVYAQKSDGSLWGWGYNAYGSVGNGSTSSQTTPYQIISSGVTQLVRGGGGYTALAVKSDGSLWDWGYNPNGGVGNNTTVNQKTPIQIMSSGVVKAYVAGNTSFARKTDGSLWAWGANVNGLIGDNSTTDRLTPYQVISSGVAEVYPSYNSIFVRKTDGSLWAWGTNTAYGIIGNNTTTQQLTPVRIIASGVTDVTTSSTATFAIKSDGSLWGWGENTYGNVGIGGTSAQLVPAQVISSGVMSVSGYINTFFALKSDGSVWGWGYNNSSYSVGNGSMTNQLTPVQIIASGVTYILGSSNGSFALKSDGSLWGWGGNGYGDIATGTVGGAVHTPYKIAH